MYNCSIILSHTTSIISSPHPPTCLSKETHRQYPPITSHALSWPLLSKFCRDAAWPADPLQHFVSFFKPVLDSQDTHGAKGIHSVPCLDRLCRNRPTDPRSPCTLALAIIYNFFYRSQLTSFECGRNSSTWRKPIQSQGDRENTQTSYWQHP